MRNEVTKYATFSRRAFIAGSLKLTLLSLISGRYFFLQIKNSEKYKTLSENNRIKIIAIPPLRGLIKDRNENIISDNKIHHRLSVDNSVIKDLDSLIPTVEKILKRPLKLSIEDLKKIIKRKSKNEPLVIDDSLTWNEVSNISIQSNEIPGIEVVEIPIRSYLGKENFACITGYIGSPNEDEIESLSLTPYNELKIGKSGIEKKLDNKLRGQPGIKQTEINVKGQYVRQISVTDSISGEDIKTTIDSNLQNAVCGILRSRNINGAIVVMDAQNGEVLAMHSSPTFNPNEFVEGVSQKYWDSLRKNPNNPLINNVVSTPYPPGSTFKLVTAVAALRFGMSPQRKHHCSGIHYVGSKPFKCWKSSGHGTLNLHQAIAQSCNPYFYSIAQSIGPDIISETAKILGFGQKTEIEISYEHPGLIPDPTWKKKTIKQPWYPGDTVNTAIGQGFVLSTPIQIATMTSRIASGKFIKPTLILKEEQPIISNLSISTNLLQHVRIGMFEAANKPLGTVYGHKMSHKNLQVCGKTGTSQVAALKFQSNSRKYLHHGLFTSFAPFDNPKYVVTVIVEHGKAGALSAAPVAKDVYDILSGKKLT